ncbi:MAG: DUF58 domain-containing protein [Halanaerobiaceae bacterium]
MNRKWVNAFLILIVTIAVFAGFQNASSVVFTCGAVIFIILVARFWNIHIFDKLVITRSLSKRKVFPGQVLFYQIKIENRKFLPVVWLRIRDKISPGLSFVNKKFIFNLFGGQGLFQDVFNLRWYEILRKRYKFYAERRGIYSLGRGDLLYYGLLGLFSNRKNDTEQIELTVYPRIVSVSMPASGYSRLFGTNMMHGWIYRDQLNRIGVRPYQPGDSFKQINWKTSARHLQLESDIYKPSFDKEVHFFLDSSCRHGWHSQNDYNRMELAVICTASLMEKYFKEGFQVGFYTNFSVKKSRSADRYTVIEADKNPAQREKILTTLARLQSFSTVDMSRILKQKKQGLSSGTMVIIVSINSGYEMNRILRYYNRFYRLLMVQVGGERVELPEINCLYLSDEEEWHEIEKIELIS